MKIKIIITLHIIFANICLAQDFNKFQKMFQEVKIPFAVDSCSVEALVALDDSFPIIDRKMQNFIPVDLREDIFKEQSVRAYYKFPLSENFVSLLILAASYEDGWRVTNSDFYLVNYDFDGHIIDYVKILRFYVECGHRWCTVNKNDIYVRAYEMDGRFDFDSAKGLPMTEGRYHYRIDQSGHFCREVEYSRSGYYKPSYNGCTFIFNCDFSTEKK